jgi:hypothetical protein
MGMAHPGGAPTKYDPKYCEQIIEFFDVEPSHQITEVVEGKNWSKQTVRDVANKFPTFEKFAFSIGVNGDTVVEWEKNYPEFSAAYKKAKQLQKDFLIQNGLCGLYNAAAFCFVAKNCTDMRDKQEIENTHIFPREIRIKSTQEIAKEREQNGQSGNRDCVKSD